MLKIRLSMGGAKKRPVYRIVVAGKAVEIELLSASNIFYIAFLFYHFVFK